MAVAPPLASSNFQRAGVIDAMPEIPVLAPAAEPGRSGKGKWIIIAIAATLILAAAGVGAWLSQFWVHPQAHDKQAPAAQEPLAPPRYLALDPPFVVNFEAEQLVRFLQVTVQVMSRDPATIDLIHANDPVVRNDLLLLFAYQKYAVIATREGKEQLRAQTLSAVRKVVANAGGKPEKVEAVYFTSFVMQ
jgi:flagellar FliL protein